MLFCIFTIGFYLFNYITPTYLPALRMEYNSHPLLVGSVAENGKAAWVKTEAVCSANSSPGSPSPIPEGIPVIWWVPQNPF